MAIGADGSVKSGISTGDRYIADALVYTPPPVLNK